MCNGLEVFVRSFHVIVQLFLHTFLSSFFDFFPLSLLFFPQPSLLIIILEKWFMALESSVSFSCLYLTLFFSLTTLSFSISLPFCLGLFLTFSVCSVRKRKMVHRLSLLFLPCLHFAPSFPMPLFFVFDIFPFSIFPSSLFCLIWRRKRITGSVFLDFFHIFVQHSPRHSPCFLLYVYLTYLLYWVPFFSSYVFSWWIFFCLHLTHTLP